MAKTFSKKQIQRYILMYTAVVIILIGFFFINNSLNENRIHEKKSFSAADINKTTGAVEYHQANISLDETEKEGEPSKSKIILLDKAY